MINEINFYSIGSSTNISTFSGIPFFLAMELESRGIRVNRIDLSPSSSLSKWYNRIVRRLVLFFYPNTLYDFTRSWWYDLYIKQKIRKSNNIYPDAEISFFVTYCAHNYKKNQYNVLFGDWNFEYLLDKRTCLKKDLLEKKYVKRENKYIDEADLVISLFPLSAQYIKSKLPNSNTVHLGLNVVNNINPNQLNKKELLNRKSKRKKILFIGRGYYIEGLRLLIDALISLNEEMNGVELDVIGLTKEDVFKEKTDIVPNVRFHGFLRKDNPLECELYYQLLCEASLFINPTSKWAGYSSMIEAMYYYIPIITSPYGEFVNEFGEDIAFGKYYDGKRELKELIKDILVEDELLYIQRCNLAHKAVENHTWSHYVDLLLKKIKI